MKRTAQKNTVAFQSLERRQMMTAAPLTIAFSGGTLTITGGAANDQVYVTRNENAWTITDAAWTTVKNLVNVKAININTGNGDDSITLDPTLTLPATLSGSNGNDTLVGDSGNDKLYGNAGNDLVTGGSGNDLIAGGMGSDTLDGGAGTNTLDYTEHTASQGVTITMDGSTTDGMTGETDTIVASSFQIVNGGAGNDSIVAAAGNLTINGGAGNDTLIAADGSETLDGGAGNDSVVGGTGNQSLYGNAGNDTLVGGAGVQTLNGGDGVDSITAGIGNQSILGGTGNDIILGSTGTQTIVGGDGNDSITGTDGTYKIYGGSGNDTILGGSNNDTIYSGTGNDHVDGGAGDDLIVTLSATGKSTVTGNDGTDTFWCNTADTITDASSDETAAGAVHKVNAFIGEKGAAVTKDLNGQALADPTIGIAHATYRNFKNNPLFASGGPTIDDVDQGQVGDCYFLAQVASYVHLSPELIKQSIVDLGDGTYAVQFVKNGVDKFYRVDADLPSYSANQTSAAALGQQGSTWVALMEKAWTAARSNAGTYASIAAGWMGEVASAFGQSTTWTGINGGSDANALLAQIEQALAAGQSVTIGTNGGQASDSLMVGGHAYTIMSVQSDGNGGYTMTVRNPWGVDGYTVADGNNDGYVTLTAAQVIAACDAVNFAAV